MTLIEYLRKENRKLEKENANKWIELKRDKIMSIVEGINEITDENTETDGNTLKVTLKTAEEKDSLSHRSKALTAFAERLMEYQNKE